MLSVTVLVGKHSCCSAVGFIVKRTMALRWGVVSTGLIAQDFVNAFNSHPDNKGQVITAVAATDPIRARIFSKAHKIDKVYTSYRDMAESKDIDIAYIAALNPDHYGLSMLFLNNGKHVLCEKPLCMNYDQTKSLIEHARTKKLFFMEAIKSRHFPTHLALAEDIKSGKIGEVKFADITLGLPVAGVERIRQIEMGGGTSMDLGPYCVQFAQYIFKDEPVKVSVVAEFNERDGVDEFNTIVLEYSGDRKAVLIVHGKLVLMNKATVYGTKGRITLPDPFFCGEEIVRADGKVDKFPLHMSPLPFNFGNSAGLAYEALHVKKCIDEGLLESPRLSHSDSLAIAKLHALIRRQLGVKYRIDDVNFLSLI